MSAITLHDSEFPTGDLWVFGYGSLMWKPGFDFVERLSQDDGHVAGAGADVEQPPTRLPFEQLAPRAAREQLHAIHAGERVGVEVRKVEASQALRVRAQPAVAALPYVVDLVLPGGVEGELVKTRGVGAEAGQGRGGF